MEDNRTQEQKFAELSARLQELKNKSKATNGVEKFNSTEQRVSREELVVALTIRSGLPAKIAEDLFKHFGRDIAGMREVLNGLVQHTQGMKKCLPDWETVTYLSSKPLDYLTSVMKAAKHGVVTLTPFNYQSEAIQESSLIWGINQDGNGIVTVLGKPHILDFSSKLALYSQLCGLLQKTTTVNNGMEYVVLPWNTHVYQLAILIGLLFRIEQQPNGHGALVRRLTPAAPALDDEMNIVANVVHDVAYNIVDTLKISVPNPEMVQDHFSYFYMYLMERYEKIPPSDWAYICDTMDMARMVLNDKVVKVVTTEEALELEEKLRADNNDLLFGDLKIRQHRADAWITDSNANVKKIMADVLNTGANVHVLSGYAGVYHRNLLLLHMLDLFSSDDSVRCVCIHGASTTRLIRSLKYLALANTDHHLNARIVLPDKRTVLSDSLIPVFISSGSKSATLPQGAMLVQSIFPQIVQSAREKQKTLVFFSDVTEFSGGVTKEEEGKGVRAITNILESLEKSGFSGVVAIPWTITAFDKFAAVMNLFVTTYTNYEITYWCHPNLASDQFYLVIRRDVKGETPELPPMNTAQLILKHFQHLKTVYENIACLQFCWSTGLEYSDGFLAKYSSMALLAAISVTNEGKRIGRKERETQLKDTSNLEVVKKFRQMATVHGEKRRHDETPSQLSESSSKMDVEGPLANAGGTQHRRN